MDLQNADTATNRFHTTLKPMVNLKWFMSNVHVIELNDTFIYIILISDMSTE